MFLASSFKLLVRLCLTFACVFLFSAAWAQYDRLSKVLTTGEYGYINTCIVTKENDQVFLYEKHKHNANDPVTNQSVTKSITGILIGCAIKHGYLKHEKVNLNEIFPEFYKNHDVSTGKISVEDLLTMKTGMRWDDHATNYSDKDNPLRQLNSLNEHPLNFLLSQQMATDPGEEWHYNSGAAVLLAAIIEKVTDRSLEDFATKYLFKPLQISSAQWRYHIGGLAHTGGGLYLSPSDMSKIGMLMLNKGKYNGQQVVSENWVEKSLTPHTALAVERKEYNAGYGYMWWVFPLHFKGRMNNGRKLFYAALGYRGKAIIIVPDEQLVITIAAATPDFAREKKLITLVYDYILQNND